MTYAKMVIILASALCYLISVFSYLALPIAITLNVIFFASLAKKNSGFSLEFVKRFIVSDSEKLATELSSGQDIAYYSFIPIIIFIFGRIYECIIFTSSNIMTIFELGATLITSVFGYFGIFCFFLVKNRNREN
jgi:hypothetical protein